jgi:hypothetical protein
MAKNTNYMFNLILPSTFLLLIAAVIVIIHSGYLREGFEQKYSLEYYYMDGCGHCVDFNNSGVWEKIAEKNWANTTVHKYNMKEQYDRVKMFKITGFPSIVMVDISGSDHVVLAPFNGERTYSKIEEFINKFTR